MTIKIITGDCREVLKTLADCSVDSVVCDPPYELTSKRPGGRSEATGGFMGMKWDGTGVAFDPAMWAEALRVLKPGGHLLAFGGTRTYHRMACAIEDAGFEIRDQIGWVYSSGFPKSHNLDKLRGAAICGCVDAKTRPDTRAAGDASETAGRHRGAAAECEMRPGPYTEQQPAAEPGNVAGQRQSQEGGAWPICRRCGKPMVPAGLGTALKPAHEPIVVARKPLIGTVAQNVLMHGTGALNIDGCRVTTDEVLREGAGNIPARHDPAVPRGRSGEASANRRYREAGGTDFAVMPGPRGGDSAGRWPANLIHDGSDEVVALFPTDAGASAPVRGTEPTANGFSGAVAFGGMLGRQPGAFYGDAGSAARFFYCAKSSRADRNEGLENPGPQFQHGSTLRDAETLGVTRKGNHHPTVKPVALMRYLCRLVTPPSGIVLDPFMGSGSTLKAAELEGFSAIGIELDPEYVAIARRRIAADAPLFADVDVA